MAEGLAEAGAKVAVLGRNKERGEAKAKEISKKVRLSLFLRMRWIQKASSRRSRKLRKS